MLKRIRKYLNVKTSVLIYKSFILPILEYGSILYMNASKSHLDRLQTLQNYALKCCLDVNKRTHTSIIHKKNKFNYLEESRKAQLLKNVNTIL